MSSLAKKKLVYVVVLLLLTNPSFCQRKNQRQSKLKVYCKLPTHNVTEIKDLEVSVSLISYYKQQIGIEGPIHFGDEIEGNIFFEIYKESGNKKFTKLPKQVLFDYDPLEIKHNYLLSYGDSLNLRLKILGFFEKGNYKFRAVYRDITKGNLEFNQSNWFFFQVKDNITEVCKKNYAP